MELKVEAMENRKNQETIARLRLRIRLNYPIT
jgi:hypothetical protein